MLAPHNGKGKRSLREEPGVDKSTEEFQRYLQGIEFPASKQEVASAAQSNGAPQNVVQKLKNANWERFDDPLQALQAMGGSA